MTPTEQDGERLQEETVDAFLVAYFGGWDVVEETGADLPQSAVRARMRAALAAVAPDIAAQARRECAEELLAALPEWRCPSCGAVTRARMADHDAPTVEAEQLASALNVALAWHDGRATGTDAERAEELAGCRVALSRWSGSGRTPADEG